MVSNPYTASMDPAPKANPRAELVTECFEGCPAFETLALNWLPITPLDLKPVKGSGWGGVGEPAIDKEKDDYRDDKVADILLDERGGGGNMPASPWGWLPGLAGHAVDINGQGQQTFFFADMSRLDLVGGYTLPSLKELGLDMYLEKRN